MSTEKNLNNLVINKVESQDVYDYMKANSLINEDELYLVEGDNEIIIDEATETTSGLMSAADKVKLNGIEENANNYTHPSYTARNEGLYKIIVDTTGHISNAVEVTKDDITSLGIPAQDTTYSEATATSAGLMSATDKSRLDGLVATGGEANQNAFSNVVVGDKIITADNTTDTFIITAGDNITLTPDEDNNGVTITAKDTTYGAAGANLGLVKTGGDATIADGVITIAELDSKVEKVDGKGLSTNDYTTAEKEKLAGIEEGANKTTVDSALSSTSTNPVQNKIINTKFDSIQADIDSKVDAVDGMGLSTNDYTTAEKNKLAGIESGANNYSLPVATSDTLGGIKSGTDITIDSSGNVSVNDDSHNHIIANVDGLQTELDGKVDKVDGKGLSTNDLTATLKSNYDTAYTHSQQAHAPSDAEKNVIVGIQKNGTDLTVNSSTRKVNIAVPTKITDLTNDSNFATTTDLEAKVDKVSGKGLSTNDYTTEEKTKLANIEDGANKTIVDTALSSTSANPVQNKVINTKLDSMQSDIDSKVPSIRTVNGKALSSNITLSASDVGALPNTTQIPSIDGLATETYVDNKVAGLVDSAPAALDTLNELAAALGDDPNFATTVATQIGTKVDKVEGKGLSTNDYTTDEKVKLSGIEEGAQVNQNAFSNVMIGGTTVSADNITDTVTLTAGDNVTLIPDSENNKITISSTDTIYTHPTYTSRINGLYKVTVDNTGHVSDAALAEKSDIVALGIPAQDTTYGIVSDTQNGLMSFGDKIKLDNIEDEANKTIVDDVLSDTSENPVQNKIVNAAITEHTNNTSNPHGVTASQVGALPIDGIAASATKLENVRSITVNLSSEAAASFDGSTDITPGVSNILRVTHGGTGRDSVPSGNYLLGNLTGAFISKTPTEVLSDIKAVGYGLAQSLTDTQKEQARDNIGAGTSSFSGDYNDLINKPEDAGSETQPVYFKDGVPIVINTLDSVAFDGYVTKGAESGSTIGASATVEGVNNMASSKQSHAEGGYTRAGNLTLYSESTGMFDSYGYEHAEGYSTLAKKCAAHAEGAHTQAIALMAHAEGLSTIASGGKSHAEGHSTTASGANAHAEGYSTTASGENTHAEGNSTTASLQAAHAEGYGTTASGYAAHAEGYSTIASGTRSHTEGFYTKASSENQHVQGKYNIEDTADTYAHIVGNGTLDTARSNAHTLDWNGNAWFAGDVYVGGSDQSSGMKLATMPVVTSITLTAANWTGSANPYSQVVTISAATANSKIDLQPTAAQIVELQNQEIQLMVENNAGTCTCYAIGGKPTSDMTMDVLITEVNRV